MPQQRFHLIILIFIDSLDTDLAERLVSHLGERMLQRLEEIEETLLQEAIQQVSEDQPNLLMAYGSEIVQRMVKVPLNTSSSFYNNLNTELCLGASCDGLEESCRKHRKRVCET